MPHAVATPVTKFARIVSRTFVLFVVAVAAACNSLDVSSPEPVTGPGTIYTLATANDINVPATFTLNGASVEITKGALTLGTDSSYIFSVILRTSVNGTQPTSGAVTLRGSFHRNDTVLTLVQNVTDTMFVGTYSPNAVSLLRAKANVTADRYGFAR